MASTQETHKSVVNSTHLSLYELLVDQLQKYTSILWQFPIAILTANAFVLDKFSDNGIVLSLLATVDAVLTFAFTKLVIQQQAIINATKNAERFIAEGGYDQFIPKFSSSKIRSPKLIVAILWLSCGSILFYSLIELGWIGS